MPGTSELYDEHDPEDLGPELQPVPEVDWSLISVPAVHRMAARLPRELLDDVPDEEPLYRAALVTGAGIYYDGEVVPTVLGLVVFGWDLKHVLPGMALHLTVDDEGPETRGGSMSALLDLLVERLAVSSRLDKASMQVRLPPCKPVATVRSRPERAVSRPVRAKTPEREPTRRMAVSPREPDEIRPPVIPKPEEVASPLTVQGHRSSEERQLELVGDLRAHGPASRRTIQDRLGWSRSTLRDVLRAAVETGTVLKMAPSPRSPFQVYQIAPARPTKHPRPHARTRWRR